MADKNIPDGMKKCPRCGEIKSRDTDFYISPKGRMSSWCRKCDSAYRVDYYEKNRADIRSRRNPYNLEYQKRRLQSDPEYRQKSIASVRAYWDSLSDEEKVKLNRRKKLLRRYNMTIEQWDEMKSSQNGACAICGDVPGDDRQFHVDHDHNTGVVRGLLCMRCNTSLEWFEKISDRIDIVMDYLSRSRINTVGNDEVEFRGKVYSV